MKTFADKILHFYKTLEIKEKLPRGVEVLNPYRDKECFELCAQFYRKFYNDNHKRIAILGINPGRFGGGITGIPFTDPVKLEKACGIKNDLPRKTELSADFIHRMIEALGGLQFFYSKFFFTSVSPLGFTHEKKNLNYYDTPSLKKSLEPFILDSLTKILDLGISRDKAFCLGEGTNYKYLSQLNERENYFKSLVPLSHPRFIMQYRRKQVVQYVEQYRRVLMV